MRITLTTILCLFLAHTVAAAQWEVGTGKPFARLEEALAKSRSGDTVLVHPQADNRPYPRVALSLNQPGITIRAVNAGGRRVVLSGEGFDYSGRGSTPRAIVQFNKDASGCVLEGFELTGAHNDSANGAGVRINQANDIIVRDCVIHGNDMGIMSGGNGSDAAANQLIENCLIYSNGNDKRAGYNHNLYLGGTSVTVIGCEIHSSLTGHNLKSRAHQTTVLACYIHDSANRELDLVDAKGDTTRPGSDALVAGNIIVKAAKCKGNRGVIHFGQDGGNDHEGTLWLVHNTVVTPFISPVVTLSSRGAQAQFWNNIVWDSGAKQNGQSLVEATRAVEASKPEGGKSNWLASGFGASSRKLNLEHTFIADPGTAPPFIADARGDYHLAGPSPAIVDAGQALPEALLKRLPKAFPQYVAPLGHAARPATGPPDLGAYERPGAGRP